MRHAPDIDHTHHPEDGAEYDGRLEVRDDALDEYRGREDEANAYQLRIPPRVIHRITRTHVGSVGEVHLGTPTVLGHLLGYDTTTADYLLTVSGVHSAYTAWFLRAYEKQMERDRVGNLLIHQWQAIALSEAVGHTSRDVPCWNERRERKANVGPRRIMSGTPYHAYDLDEAHGVAIMADNDG